MDNVEKIIEALEHCKKNGAVACDGCPYCMKLDGITCRQLLCNDAAEAIRELMEEQNSVGSKNETAIIELFKAVTDKTVETVKEAHYWRGYAAALQYALCDQYNGVEAQDDV